MINVLTYGYSKKITNFSDVSASIDKSFKKYVTLNQTAQYKYVVWELYQTAQNNKCCLT